jgi:hypothetical protein
MPETRSTELVNVFRDVDGKSLRRRPGQSLFKDFGEAGRPILGLYDPLDKTLSGSQILTLRNGAATAVLAKLNSTGTATTLTQSGATLANTTLPTWADGPVSGSPRQFVANGGRIFWVNMVGNTATAITTGNAPNSVSHIGFAKTYLISNGLISGGLVGDTNFSDDSSAVPPYGAAGSWELFNNEQLPDACDGLIIDHDEIVAWGSHSAEVSYNDGVTPWAVLDGGYYPHGIVNSYTVVNMGTTLYFLGWFDNEPHVVRINQRQPQILSTPYDPILKGFSTFADARAWSVAYKGQAFYVLSFPTDNYTLVYNPTFNEWYRWSTYAAGSHLEWNINAALYVRGWNKSLIGDKTDAKIFYLDDSKDDSGTEIRTEITSGLLTRGTLNRKRAEEYRFVFLRGDVSDASEPTIIVEFDDDNEGFYVADTVSLGTSSDKFVWAEVRPGGVYHSRRIRLTHSGTKSSLILVEALERVEVMLH